jgi:flagellar hook-associated protein 2
MTTSPISFNGLISGLNTQSIISAEMTPFEQPLNDLKAQQTALNTQISDYQTINNQLLALQQAADALAVPSAFDQAFAATSSDSAAATASITSGTQSGTLTLAVDQLATGSTQISAGTVASPNDVVGSGSLLLGVGGAALGVSSFASPLGLSAGPHTLTVTQSSLGATATGTTAPAASTTVTSANDTLQLTVDGTAQTLTLADGTYTAAQLAAAVTTASGGSVVASVDPSGVISLATTQQGSAATLQVTGGTALTALGLTAGAATSGTDGVISLDGTATTVTSIAGTGTTAVSLNSGTGGSLTVNLSGPLTAGSMTAQSISVGTGSLSSVVSAINSSGLGVDATAIQVGSNSYALELSSTGTGTSGAVTVDAGAFATSGLGQLNTVSAAQDAIASIGGVGGYQVTSQTNALTGILPGVTIQLAQASTSPVTITVSPDGTQMANTVQTLVNAANAVLQTISTDTAYDAQTQVAGPLNGQISLTILAQQVLAMVGEAVGTSAAGSDGTVGESAGLSVDKSGVIGFNATAFAAAYAKNPTAVQSMFTEGGTFAAASPTYAGAASVAGAGDNTVPGAYALSVTQSASQATDTGSATFAASTATVAQAETYTVTSGTDSASYAVTAGETVADVVNGMNAALASAGIDASAALVGSAGALQLQLASASFGSAATFGVATSGSDQLGLTTAGATYAGVDVAGTIDGQAATGDGQILSLASASDPANGLAVEVTATGISAATDLGTVTYAPGFAQGLAQISKQASLAPSGMVAATIAGLQGTLANVGQQITQQNALVAIQQASLEAEFNAMETSLAQLQSESQFLTASSNLASGSTSTTSSSSSSSNALGNSTTSTGS